MNGFMTYFGGVEMTGTPRKYWLHFGDDLDYYTDCGSSQIFTIRRHDANWHFQFI